MTPVDPTIRSLTAADIPAVLPLLHQLAGQAMTPEGMQSRLDFVARSPFDWLFACEVAGQVCGVLGLRLRERLEVVGRDLEVYLIVTDQQVRRQGVGRALMAFAEQFAQAHDCGRVFLVSGLKRKDEAHRFYAQLGYEITGYRFVKALDD